MHNLSTVIRFEIIRTLKKKSFWLMALGFPVMIALIFGIIFFSNKSTNEAVADLQNQKFSITVLDQSGMVNPALVKALGATISSDKQTSIDAVIAGKLDAFIYYPKDLQKDPIEIYGQDVGIFNNGRYGGVATALLQNSIQAEITPSVRAIVKGDTSQSVTTYRDGKQYDSFKEMILPGVFLVLFYMLIAFFGGMMLTSTTEEKENRVIEMILTTIEARTLIIGKIIALVTLALLQAGLIIIPALTIYLLFHDKLQIPNLDLTSLPVDPIRIIVGASIFLVSILLFTGLLVLIGSSVPTAKEASQFMALVMILIFGPLYAAPLFISAPDSIFVRLLSLFPLTSPIPLMLRNAVGNLTTWETILSIIILIISAIAVLTLAVRVFRFGALEYDRKISLKEMFGR